MDSLSPSLSAIVGLLTAITLFTYYLLRWSRIGLAKIEPILVGAWPIIGHFPLLGGTQPPHMTLGAMADKYGPIFAIKLGLHPALFQGVLDHQRLGRVLLAKTIYSKTLGL